MTEIFGLCLLSDLSLVSFHLHFKPGSELQKVRHIFVIEQSFGDIVLLDHPPATHVVS